MGLKFSVKRKIKYTRVYIAYEEEDNPYEYIGFLGECLFVNAQNRGR